MRALDRAAFLPPQSRDRCLPRRACGDRAGTDLLPALHGRLHARQARYPWPGSRVLEVGAGCGYAAALIALLLLARADLWSPRRYCPSSRPWLRVNCSVALATSALAAGMGRASVASVELVAVDGSDRHARARALRPHHPVGRRAAPFLPRGAAAGTAGGGGILLYPEARGRLYRITLDSLASTRGNLLNEVASERSSPRDRRITHRTGGLIRESWSGVAFVDLRGDNA